MRQEFPFKRAAVLVGLSLLLISCSGERQPAASPAKPVTEAAKPEYELAKPVTEAAKPEYEPAKSPEACLRNVHLAAEAKDLDGLKACLVGDAKEIIELARPRVQEVAKSADELLNALRKEGLQVAADRLADHPVITCFSLFDDDLLLQYSDYTVARRSIKEMNETTAIMIEEKRSTKDGARSKNERDDVARAIDQPQTDELDTAESDNNKPDTFEYHLRLEDGDWKLLPRLPGCLIAYTGTKGCIRRGRVYVGATSTSYAQARSSLNVLVEVNKMFAQLTASVAGGRFDDDQEFFEAYNNSANALTK